MVDPHAADLTSTANPRVKALVRLRTRRARTEAGVTLVEGHDELRLALEAGVRPSEVFWAPSLVREPDLLDAVGRARVTSVSRDVFARVAYRESPDGWLAVVPAPERPLEELELGANPLVLVAEGIEKPGNVGAMLRTAEACGADAVVAASAGTDFGNPNVVRASKGTVFAVPVAAADSDDVLAWLRARGLRIVVTTPAGTTRLDRSTLGGPAALVVGTEATGVTDRWLENADETVVIPMRGTVNSLNAATAAALALYEATRQRNAADGS
ncbi:TrmH family RNA methyltransferase [Pseudonocardia endophytica]|uniref:TrmH family RNA methyltransferase n=1 Tax=Pseudonocardia endophytica TaxID=401976 RepID=A0A4R1HV88_PSEEN|nr:RNA methyltransferase [Pseudonocardia endophytica]TCK26178.1 TrmH family RNA methyltransferase [Pseudonocardia endophytica]